MSPLLPCMHQLGVLVLVAFGSGCSTPPTPATPPRVPSPPSSPPVEPRPKAEPRQGDAGLMVPDELPYDVAPRLDSLLRLARGVMHDGGIPAADHQVFPDRYTTLDGVFTFRGGHQRTGGAFGLIPEDPVALEIAWQVRTAEGVAPWFGGAGWTGQPAIVRWPEVIRHSMVRLGARRFKGDLVEVIQGSLDGNVYFLDLYTGKRTRTPLVTKNPIKGSVSVDPRGYPLLFVGQGIPRDAPIGLRVYDLIRHHEVFFLAGRDQDAPRRSWGAFDSSGLLNRLTDTYVVGGENGLIYLLKLNTRFDPINLSLAVRPEITRYRYRHPYSGTFGVENSLSVLRNLAFFADNSGLIQAVDLRHFTPIWAFDAGDDTDASLTVDVEGGRPILYTGNEVDRTGPIGQTHLRRLDGLTGKVEWDVTRSCQGARAPKKIDAGLFATNVVGTGDVGTLVFFTLARCPGPENGMILALEKGTGKEVWKAELPHFSWSSPTAVRTPSGHTYLLQGGIGGLVRLFDARSGAIVATVKLQGEIEASPAAFDDHVVLATRGNRIYGLVVRGR